ncbi:hypothetical protein [Aphanothece hegewaldii]|uniref:hypothetical protein n=1 Tax=Aphanothece hegewaldii TaxID=1521625 RepID=UPI0011B2800A|nr:hypothetical protein [Aphanothece hegewaldii]
MKKNTKLAILVALFGWPITLINSAEAAIIKKYDFESGNYSGVNRQYQDKTCSTSSNYIDNSLFDIVDSPGGRSGKAVRHNIENCDERSEFVVPVGTLKADSLNIDKYGQSSTIQINHETQGATQQDCPYLSSFFSKG